MEFEAKNLPFASFEKLGMTKKDVLGMPPDDLKSLLSGRTTSMKELKVNMEGIDFKEKAKLSLYAMPDNSLAIRVHPFRTEIKNEFDLKPQDIERLKKGDLIVAPKTSLNGEREKYIFQLDKEINEIKNIRVNNINLPKAIMDVDLTQKNKSDLLEGKSVNIKNKEGQELAVAIDLINTKGFSIKSPEQAPRLSNDKETKVDLSIIDDLRTKNKLSDKDYNTLKEGVIKELEGMNGAKQSKGAEMDIAKTVKDLAANAGIKLEKDKDIVKAIENPDRKIEVKNVADLSADRKEVPKTFNEAIKSVQNDLESKRTQDVKNEPRFLNYNDKESALSGKADIYALLTYKFGQQDSKSADALLSNNKISKLEHEVIKDGLIGDLLRKESGKTTDRVYSDLLSKHADSTGKISPEVAKTLLSNKTINDLEHDIIKSRNNGLLEIPEIKHLKTYSIENKIPEKPAEDRMVGRDTRGKLYEGTNVKAEYFPGEVVKWDYKISPEVMRKLENDSLVQKATVKEVSQAVDTSSKLNNAVKENQSHEIKPVKLSENPDIKPVAQVDLGFVRNEIRRDHVTIGQDSKGQLHEGIKTNDDKVLWKSQMSDAVKDLVKNDQIVLRFEPKLETGEKIAYGKDLKGNYYHTKNEDGIDVGLKNHNWTPLNQKEGKLMEFGETKLSSERANSRSGAAMETPGRNEGNSINAKAAPEEKQERTAGFKR